MNSKFLTNYSKFLLPGIILAGAAYLGNVTGTVGTLAIVLYMPVFMLAAAGLGAYFPEENRKTRKPVHIVEFAIVRGLMFGVVMSFFYAVKDGMPQALAPVLIAFARNSLLFAIAMGAFDFFDRWNLRGGRPTLR